MDFLKIKEKVNPKNHSVEIYPEFIVKRSKDLFVRGGTFYGVWNEEENIWSTDEYIIQTLIDKELFKRAKELEENCWTVKIKLMSEFSSGSWSMFKKFLTQLSNNYKQLDNKITFNNTNIKKEDYISKKLEYNLEEGNIESYDLLMSTLYSKEEREKIEWAIGSIIKGDSKDIQKFIVFYGPSGTGKSTVIHIIEKLFKDYYVTFEAKELANNSNNFSLETFKSNPLIAIQHDGDLSKIEDNSRLNSLTSHEEMTINEKHKSQYTLKINCFLFMGTNKPVKITDAKSGIIRRLIDVIPSGNKLSTKKYNVCMNNINFELGAIAYHCLEVYNKLGKYYYDNYKPIKMMYKTDPFFNFVEENLLVFKNQDYVLGKQAYILYKEWIKENDIPYKLPEFKFKDELQNYFKEYYQRYRTESGEHKRHVYIGLLENKFEQDNIQESNLDNKDSWLELNLKDSLFDKQYQEYKAQYASEKGTPSKRWDNCKTLLKDLDTSKLHYIKLEENHIVIDFDLKDENGNKSKELNIMVASKFPKTYAEFSKSGNGIHLHYFYKGDVNKLIRIYSKDIEIKVFTGNASLRRQLSYCNDIPINEISSGLPLKGAKMINITELKDENNLRNLIKKNLRKEIHAGTKPSIDFIHKILEDAYSSNLKYDISDMRPTILAFAANSTNQSEYCLKLVSNMKFKGQECDEVVNNNEIVFFDIEVFPNLFIICWKGVGEDKQVVKMINPKPNEVEELLKFRLIGFNNKRYDNHILYAAILGYTPYELFMLSQRIVNNSKNALFISAYNLSYTDVYDFSSKKQSLKKFEIELGIKHKECPFKWDVEVPEEDWNEVADYCCNDVIATEKVFESRKDDWIAREILSDLSGLSVNNSTQKHAAKIIFGNDTNYKDEFVYTDLSKEFPGYKFDNGKSYYKGEEPGEGGYVYAEPGSYTNVILLDVASMHPSSIIKLNLFGKYTKRFKDIVDGRILIKHKELEPLKELLDGVIYKYAKESKDLNKLAYALKIVINIIYGMTFNKNDNPFYDKRNIDNIVAKRGALFMIDLKYEVQKRGYSVVHIKTDSIKIPNANEDIINFVINFGKKYGYNFEVEKTYESFCLVNDAVYISYFDNKWEAVGAQFKHPYVFKKLFSHEEIDFNDLCETRAVTSNLYLNTGSEEDPVFKFVGKVGKFVPMKHGYILMREKNDKYYYAPSSKGYLWMEADMVQQSNLYEDIDYSYFDKLCEDAKNQINKFTDFDNFVNHVLPFA